MRIQAKTREVRTPQQQHRVDCDFGLGELHLQPLQYRKTMTQSVPSAHYIIEPRPEHTKLTWLYRLCCFSFPSVPSEPGTDLPDPIVDAVLRCVLASNKESGDYTDTYESILHVVAHLVRPRTTWPQRTYPFYFRLVLMLEVKTGVRQL